MSRVRDLSVVVAGAAVTAAFSGPAAAAFALSKGSVEVFARTAARAQLPVYERTVQEMAAGIRSWAEGERMSDATPVGLARAGELVARHGADTDDMARLGLRPGPVAELVFDRGRRLVTDLSEAEEQVCRRAVSTVYERLLADSEVLPALERSFQREVLARMDDLAAALRHVADSATEAPSPLRTTVRTWSPRLYPPSALLRAEFRIVPFEGREREIDDLLAWCVGDDPVAVRLYTGAGGMGKTRLMVELCLLAEDRGWTAGFLDGRASDLGPDQLAVNGVPGGPVLVVVDYAETRPELLVELFTLLLADTGRRTRCVLLARAATDWWFALRRQRGGVGDLLTGPATTLERLRPLATAPGQRAAIAERARDAFAAKLGRTPQRLAEPWVESHFERVLFLHLAALRAALDAGGGAVGDDALLDAALAREQSFWDEGVRSLGLVTMAGRPVAQAVAVATLAGRVNTPSQAVELLRACPLLADQPAANLDRLAELLHGLYPGEAWLQGVQPDLLGEHLVGRALADDPGLLGLFDVAR